RETDPCPRCAGDIRFARGIEVGHVFKLGTKYSKAMKAVYLDKNGKEQYLVMGCYGIGVGRTVAACIEQYHDENGIIWPLTIAPYEVIITPVNMNDRDLAAAAEKLYTDLLTQGVEVIIDDRDERAGVKFKDADLIGIPLRVTIGPKNLAAGKVEIKDRRTGEVSMISVAAVKNFILSAIR
ncbi:MAG: prolyl-tRNA synthetase, partial [Thermodesulfobacteriota bacterium]|nr:prolyl-tRNA synthetase [Thermodesulfobacteriota bacterium]